MYRRKKEDKRIEKIYFNVVKHNGQETDYITFFTKSLIKVAWVQENIDAKLFQRCVELKKGVIIREWTGGWRHEDFFQYYAEELHERVRGMKRVPAPIKFDYNEMLKKGYFYDYIKGEIVGYTYLEKVRDTYIGRK